MQSKTKAGITICNQKREQSMPKVIGHIFFLPCPSSNFLKKHNALAADSVSVFKQRSTYACDLRRWSYSLSLGTIQTVKLLRYAPENRPSLRVIIGKWLLKNYKLTTELSSKT
jgi:hypothetical protein